MTYDFNSTKFYALRVKQASGTNDKLPDWVYLSDPRTL